MTGGPRQGSTVPAIRALDRALSVGLTLAALVIAAVLVEQRLGRRRATPATRQATISDWRARSRDAAIALSAESAAVEVVVFTDFQCPFCRALDSTLTAMEAQLPGRIQRKIAHFPLPMHGSARPAATAFECARSQGVARAMHSALFARQQDIGVASWQALAKSAGVADMNAFGRCMDESAGGQVPAIDQGIALARELKLSGTPAAVVQGVLLDPATSEGVRLLVERALRARH